MKLSRYTFFSITCRCYLRKTSYLRIAAGTGVAGGIRCQVIVRVNGIDNPKQAWLGSRV